ncbi:uncharacterized protein LOC121415124 [Lytechinus variegatus]|uniref:uncharacterized protein LOC121415124 n=1 Tax=Lytechinus variegatus TaxID=7654 RepID=UPI001BB1DBAB|nr:uncharacterized protein LOC121415124 [Lytechinus variegatus]
MAARGQQRSSFLSDDSKIYELSETINAPEQYEKLGRALLGSNPEVANLIGVMSMDYENVVFKFFSKWRDANGCGDGQCRTMIEILKDCGLTDVATWLKDKQGQQPNCLGDDKVLQDLSFKIDCPKYVEKLGRKLTESEVEYSSVVGGNRPPNYKEALYQCLIKWRNAEGSSLESSRKLWEVLCRRRLSIAVKKLEEFEPSLVKDAVTTQCSEETGEPVAGVHIQGLVKPCEENTSGLWSFEPPNRTKPDGKP